MNLRTRLKEIRERIAKAAEKTGRRGEDILLLAACKGVDTEKVIEAIEEGVRLIGDNYVQEARQRLDKLAPWRGQIEWHFIGHLQRNKVKAALDMFDMIETVDSLALARELDKVAKAKGKTIPVLVEVNIGEEESKFGVKPQEALDFLVSLAPMENLRIMGLMTMGPPLGGDRMRPYFAKMREIFERAKELERNYPNIQMRLLSMGMSSDYEVAIEEGANLVRIGTALFGERR